MSMEAPCPPEAFDEVEYKKREAHRIAMEQQIGRLEQALAANSVPPPRETTVGDLLERVIEELRTRLVGAETLRRSLTPDMLHLPYSQFNALRMLL